MDDLAVYFDLDGVKADYVRGIERLGFKPDPAKKNELNRSGSGDPFKRACYEAIKGTDFFARLPLMPGAVDLYREVQAHDPIILTAAPTFGAGEDDYYLDPNWLGAAYHKRWWVEHVLLPHALPDRVEKWGMMVTQHHYRIAIPDARFICTTSLRKQEFIHRKHSEHQLLFDDRRDNCVRWARAGGVAILHTSVSDSIAALRRYRREDLSTFTETPGHGLIHGLDSAHTWAELEAAALENT